MTRISLLPWLLLAALACAHTAATRPVEVAPHQEPMITLVDTSEVPALSLEGVFLDPALGTGLPYAHVSLRAPTQSSPRLPLAEATTDSNGRFTIVAPDTGLMSLDIRLIGYRAIETDVRFGRSKGMMGIFETGARPVALCPLIIAYPHSVAVQVRDAITAQSISGASLEVIDGSYRDSVVSTAPSVAGDGDTDPSLLIAGDRPGDFEVIVRHPFYREWRAHHVKPTAGDCGLNPAELAAMLIPRL